MEKFLEWLNANYLTMIYFAIVLVVGYVFIKIFIAVLNRMFTKGKTDSIIRKFVIAIVRYTLYLTLLLILFKVLGIDVTGLIALLGAAGLAISLALQGALGNMTAGMLIIANKPFKEGNFVEINSTQGKVKEIKLFVTELTTIDNRRIVIPNSKVVNDTITNYDSYPTRRVDISLSVSYDSDIDKVREVLLDVLKEESRAITLDKAYVKLGAFEESSIKVLFRFFVKTEEYYDVLWDTNEKILKAFRANNITIPFKQVDVNLINVAK